MNECTLIGEQQKAIDSILSAREITKASMYFGIAWMNKNPRVVRGIKKKYTAAALKMGFKLDQIFDQWEDIKSMAVLERNAL
jgi:uncharacterized membrane protein